MIQVRTDLAVEAKEMVAGRKGVKAKERKIDGIKVTDVVITQEAEKSVGKKAGKYLTLEARGMREKDTKFHEKVEEVFAKEFAHFLEEVGIDRQASCLLVGLGNWQVTPDSLGPSVIENVVVTKHLFTLVPEQVKGFREVSAFSPGVMGITGMETSEIIAGVIEQTKPDFLIAIDALAARRIERVNTTIQITDTGIHPGSGVGNQRKGLSKETLGIPCIALGVPTVVDAVTIANDTMDYMQNHLAEASQSAGKEKVLGLIGTLADEEKRQLIHEVLSPLEQNLIVTPKEVDMLIEDMANILANGLNAALHREVDQGNVGMYTK